MSGIWAVMPAAGIGSRFNSNSVQTPKQYRQLADQMVIEHSAEALLALPLTALVIAIKAQDPFFPRTRLAQIPQIKTTTGGSTRALSVQAGLQKLRELGAQDADLVLVHDAARPLVAAADLKRLLQVAQKNPVGALLAVRSVDSIKRVHHSLVSASLPRAEIWQAQTPQAFRLKPLEQALAQGQDFTDEAAAVEQLGLAPQVVEGSRENFKITLPIDLVLAEAVLSKGNMPCE